MILPLLLEAGNESETVIVCPIGVECLYRHSDDAAQPN